MTTARVTVVTVTYGRRWHLLRRGIEACLSEQPNVAALVVVDNGSQDDIPQKLSLFASERLILVSHGENTGSANGFKTGLKAAMERTDSEFIWLLDDDNIPSPDSLNRLLLAHASLGNDTDIALLSLRPAMRNRWKLSTLGGDFVRRARNNAFAGFHIADVPRRIAIRLSAKRTEIPPLIECGFAPYGGLFLHRSVLGRAGFPDERLFLYGDDLEFTLRLRKLNIRIFLCATSIVEDAEGHWHDQLGSFCPHLSRNAQEFRVYYLIRNSTFVEKRYGVTIKGLYLVNMAVYLSRGVFVNLLRERSPVMVYRRLLLVARAIRDGWNERLGRHAF